MLRSRGTNAGARRSTADVGPVPRKECVMTKVGRLTILAIVAVLAIVVGYLVNAAR